MTLDDAARAASVSRRRPRYWPRWKRPPPQATRSRRPRPTRPAQPEPPWTSTLSVKDRPARHPAVELLNQRLSLAADIGRLKRSKDGRIFVAEREDRVLHKVCGQNQGPMKDAALRAIYREVMSAAIALEKPLFIAYLGPEATNTHQAAIKKFGASVDYHGMATIGDIFTAVEKGEADYGVIPIENSTEGSVRDALDQFVDSDLKWWPKSISRSPMR